MFSVSTKALLLCPRPDHAFCPQDACKGAEEGLLSGGGSLLSLRAPGSCCVKRGKQGSEGLMSLPHPEVTQWNMPEKGFKCPSGGFQSLCSFQVGKAGGGVPKSL